MESHSPATQLMVMIVIADYAAAGDDGGDVDGDYDFVIDVSDGQVRAVLAEE